MEDFHSLKEYCEQEQFKGWDPYDGLNSWLIQQTPFGKSRFFRLAWIQLFKRNPVNLRPFFGVKKEYNPKGLGLFLIGYLNLYQIDPRSDYLERIHFLADRILELQSGGYAGPCWGYNFDWQARAFFQPAYTPTVVATSFVAEALFLAYEVTKREELLETAVRSAQFILQDLHRTEDEDGDFTLSYSPLDKTQVFNAGLLGAKLLSQAYHQTGQKELIESARRVVSYVCKKQQPDGAWAYSNLPYHQWIDSFHTGYNLECIHAYQEISGDQSFRSPLEKGLSYYLDNFFTEAGIPKYYNNQTYPIDIHAPAQMVVTLYKLGVLEENRELVDRVLHWTIKNMQDHKGYFYYQKKRWITSRIPYMRWAQAWMFYALSYYLRAFPEELKN